MQNELETSVPAASRPSSGELETSTPPTHGVQGAAVGFTSEPQEPQEGEDIADNHQEEPKDNQPHHSHAHSHLHHGRRRVSRQAAGEHNPLYPTSSSMLTVSSSGFESSLRELHKTCGVLKTQLQSIRNDTLSMASENVKWVHKMNRLTKKVSLRSSGSGSGHQASANGTPVSTHLVSPADHGVAIVGDTTPADVALPSDAHVRAPRWRPDEEEALQSHPSSYSDGVAEREGSIRVTHLPSMSSSTSGITSSKVQPAVTENLVYDVPGAGVAVSNDDQLPALLASSSVVNRSHPFSEEIRNASLAQLHAHVVQLSAMKNAAAAADGLSGGTHFGVVHGGLSLGSLTTTEGVHEGVRGRTIAHVPQPPPPTPPKPSSRSVLTIASYQCSDTSGAPPPHAWSLAPTALTSIRLQPRRETISELQANAHAMCSTLGGASPRIRSSALNSGSEGDALSSPQKSSKGAAAEGGEPSSTLNGGSRYPPGVGKMHCRLTASSTSQSQWTPESTSLHIGDSVQRTHGGREAAAAQSARRRPSSQSIRKGLALSATVSPLLSSAADTRHSSPIQTSGGIVDDGNAHEAGGRAPKSLFIKGKHSETSNKISSGGIQPPSHSVS